jgi:NarL family two-component system response regulator LiaR
MAIADVVRPRGNAARSTATLERPKSAEERDRAHTAVEEPAPVAKVLVVDDHPIVRAGICWWMRECPDLRVVGEADSGEQALELASRLHPDVVLLDLVLPGMSGLETLRALRDLAPDAKVVVLTSLEAGDAVRDALRAGATGYHIKGVSMGELVHAIYAAQRDKATLDPNAARRLAQAATRSPLPFEELTERERDVLRLLVGGLPNEKIADELVITEATVKYHVRSIRRKMQASNRTHIVSLAIRHRLVDDELTMSAGAVIS